MSELFDYDLPERLIAQEPLADRAASRLLCVSRTRNAIEHRQFRDVTSILGDGDLLVMNNTKVSAIRLFGQRTTGAQVEALLLRQSTTPGGFWALMRPSKRIKVGEQIEFANSLWARVQGIGEGATREVIFEPTRDLEERIRDAGFAATPPYVKQKLRDFDRYQTVYAQTSGSAAAPTAGLHFTVQILETLRKIGVKTAEVTLDVGLDTFRPIQAGTLEGHVMHGETCSISEEVAEIVNEHKGRIIAVGTTSVRTLESFADSKRQLRSGKQSTQIFITPGYDFKIVDAMFTNFHMPRTTMLQMVAAMCGGDLLMNAYRQAVQAEYRFLSFGDSMYVES